MPFMMDRAYTFPIETELGPVFPVSSAEPEPQANDDPLNPTIMSGNQLDISLRLDPTSPTFVPTKDSTTNDNTSAEMNPYRGHDHEMAALAGFLDTQSHTDIMRHFLGFPMPSAPSLMDSALLVGIDTEWHNKEPHPLTEIGMAELPVHHVPGRDPGPHAENILINIHAEHARLMENAHLTSTFRGAGKPEKFHFGTSVFIKTKEARAVLFDFFCRFAHGIIRPVVFIGHAVDSDFEKLKEDCGIDILQLGTVVKVIDTQVLAKEANIYGPKGLNIGLKHLLQHFNIFPDNLHQAGNDIAFTMIAAVLMAIKDEIYPGLSGLGYQGPRPLINGRHIQESITSAMIMSQASPLPTWGRIVFCPRCDRENHLREQCRAYVNCDHCSANPNPKVKFLARTHKTAKCVFGPTTPQATLLPDPDDSDMGKGVV